MRLPMVEACKNGDPTEIGRFRILARLGVGGFGTVYAARAVDQADEFAAVKVVHANLAGSPDFQSRFAREIAAIKRVRSAFVPRLIDDGSADDPPWMATELVPGLSLDKVVRACGPMPEPAVWRLGAGIAEALAAIHGAGLVHRDLKPHNVLLVPGGPWIIDFGLAHLTELPHQSSSRFVMATYKYAAPEQLREGLKAAEVPADIFALGATLLFAATGHPPHDADSHTELIIRAMNVKPNLAGLPRGLYHLVENCLHRFPEPRRSLAELREEFARRADSEGAGGREGFAAVLPTAVVALLDAYRAELADVTHVLGPARLGWEPCAGLESDARRDSQPTPLPPFDRPSEPSSASWPAAEPRTAVITETRLYTSNTVPAAVLSRPSSPSGNTAVMAGMSEPAEAPDHADDGPADWTYQFGSWIHAPVTAHGGIAVVACLDGTITILRARDSTGPRRQSVDVGAAVHAAALLRARGRGAESTVYVGAADGGVHTIDVPSGRHRPLFHAAGAIEGPPVAEGDRVYVLSADGCLHAIDAHTDSPDVVFRMDAPAAGAMSVTAGTVFAADADGCVHAIDTLTRRERWRLPTDGLVLGAPVPVAGRLYVSGTDGLLREAGIENARERATVDVGVPVHAAPVHDGGRLYVGGSDGVVRAYDITHQRRHGPVLLWRCPLGDEVAGLAAADGFVYAAAGYRLMRLDGVTGQSYQLFQLDCLIGAAPTISGRLGYAVGLGGIVKCLALR